MAGSVLKRGKNNCQLTYTHPRPQSAPQLAPESNVSSVGLEKESGPLIEPVSGWTLWQLLEKRRSPCNGGSVESLRRGASLQKSCRLYLQVGCHYQVLPRCPCKVAS